MAVHTRVCKPTKFESKSLLNADGTFNFYEKVWPEQRYVDTVVQIVEFFIDNHHGQTSHDGHPVSPDVPWWYAYPDRRSPKRGWYWSERMNKAWETGGGEVAYIIACLTAQHTEWGQGGVETEAPFHALEMWKVVKPLRRIQLARRFYADEGK